MPKFLIRLIESLLMVPRGINARIIAGLNVSYLVFTLL